MYNRPHRHHMWCANAWVGAPWACGEARYDESVENYENDITKSYAAIREDYSCCNDDNKYDCNDTCKGRTKYTTVKCKESGRTDCDNLVYAETNSDGSFTGRYFPCETKKGKCIVKNNKGPCGYCDTVKFLSNFSSSEGLKNSIDPTSCSSDDPYNDAQCAAECSQVSASPSSDCNKLTGIYATAGTVLDDGTTVGCVVMSNELYPWIGDGTAKNGTEGVLYGFVAQDQANSDGMGDVYRLKIGPLSGDNPANNANTIAYVQVINTGKLYGNTYNGVYYNTLCDFLIPGGGTGDYDGCAMMPKWDYEYLSDEKVSAKYGGIMLDADPASAFGLDTDAISCVNDILRNDDIFNQAGNYSGNAVVTEVVAIDPSTSDASELEAIDLLGRQSGIKPKNSNSNYLEVTDNMQMTHYWDCRKPHVTSVMPTYTDGNCPRGFQAAKVVYEADDGSLSFEDTGNSSCILDVNNDWPSSGACLYNGGVWNGKTDVSQAACTGLSAGWFNGSGCYDP